MTLQRLSAHLTYPDPVRSVDEAVENAVGHFGAPICSCELAIETCIAVLRDFACKYELEGKNMRTWKRLTIDHLLIKSIHLPLVVEVHSIEAGLERIRADTRRLLMNASGNRIPSKKLRA